MICASIKPVALNKLYFAETINSLIDRTYKVELIATEFFSNPATVWVILSNILKVASPIL